MSSLSAVMGSSAAFVHANPDVICADHDQNNISINVIDGVPSLDMENADYDVSVYIDASGGLSLNDGLVIEQDGTITAPAWSIDVSGNVSGTFILPGDTNLSAPHDVSFNNDFEIVQYVMETTNSNSIFSIWVQSLQFDEDSYNLIVFNIVSALGMFRSILDLNNSNLENFNLVCRIVVALNDGSVYYDSDKGANNTFYNASEKALGNINIRPCVMSTQMNEYKYTFETQTYFSKTIDSYIIKKEFFVATKITDLYDNFQQYGGVGNNYGTVMYSFRIDNSINNRLPILEVNSEPVVHINPFTPFNI